MQYKQISAVVLASILATAILATTAVMSQDVQAKKIKPVNPKCNNIKIQVRVSGVEENQTLVATVGLAGGVKSTAGVVEENDTSITLPVNFKKLNPCPEVGAPITGDVNGTSFDGTLKSLKKPNKISVELT
jgi:hypothetical protein